MAVDDEPGASGQERDERGRARPVGKGACTAGEKGDEGAGAPAAASAPDRFKEWLRDPKGGLTDEFEPAI